MTAIPRRMAQNGNGRMRRDEHGGSVPAPDPTVLTTQNLEREIDHLGELVDAELDLREKLFNEKFEKADLIMMERFRSVDQQFALVERQRVEQKADTKQAVDAALTAQKEAVKEQTTASERAISKSEASTKEALSQLNSTFDTRIGSMTDQFNDLKDRVGKIEGVKAGAGEQRQEQRQTSSESRDWLRIAIAIGGSVLLLWASGRLH